MATSSTPKGVVAAGHAATAEAGADVLRQGGSAVDAALASLAMACLCEPVLCSPGGGGFAMLRDGSSGRVSLIDFFPQTPQARQPVGPDGVRRVLADFGTATQAFHIGPATTASPGFVAGLEALHASGGTIPLPDLVRPAVVAARAGVTVTPFQAYLAGVVGPIMTATPGAAALYAPDGEIVRAGHVLRNPGLAEALEILAHEGLADSAVGRTVLAGQRRDGHLRQVDLTGYRAIERNPLTVDVAGATAHLNPLPAASGTLIAHSLAGLGGPDIVSLAQAFAATDVARRHGGPDLAGLDPQLTRQQGTTHVSVIDAAGNACAVTTSNGSGNGEIAEGYGFMLNNILGEEDVNPSGTDNWPTASRLSSMMCPTILEMPDGGVVALGSGGSNRIRTAISQVLVQLCIRGADLAVAIDAPRLHVELGHLDFEDLLDDFERERLVAAFPDHRCWPERNLFYGGVHAVALGGDGTLSGMGDRRRDGTAVVVQ